MSKPELQRSQVETEVEKVGSERIVWTKWVNWKTGLMAAVMAIGVIAMSSGSGLTEVHNADQPFNFPLVDPHPGPEDWPCSRGADNRNIAATVHFPTDWNPSEHEGWKSAVPGTGNSSPILWGQQLFLTSYESHSRRILLHSLHRNSGRVFWQTMIHQRQTSLVRENTSFPASTPACDGQNVFVVTCHQERLWVTAVDLKGQIAWQRDAGPYRALDNSLCSPIFYKSLILVSVDQAKDGFIAALHRQTGELIWRVKRPKGESSGSPVLATIAGGPQLILAGTGAVTSYHPATGQVLWTCRTSTDHVANSVAFDEEHVFVTRSQPNPETLCIRGTGTGDVTGTHIQWRLSKIGAESTSPVHHLGLLYVLSEEGRLTCIQSATGKIEWSKQFKGSFSTSPVIAKDYLLCASESGTTYLVSLGTGNPPVIENSLGTGITASPVVAGDSIYLRTTDRLHRIVAPAPEPFVEKPESKRRL